MIIPLNNLFQFFQLIIYIIHEISFTLITAGFHSLQCLVQQMICFPAKHGCSLNYYIPGTSGCELLILEFFLDGRDFHILNPFRRSHQGAGPYQTGKLIGSKQNFLHFMLWGNICTQSITCLLYTSDAADEEDSVDLGGRRIIKKKNNILKST